MQRDVRAYLQDIIESCDAIGVVLQGVSLDDYRATRAIRSSVEREFIIIGEAMTVLSRIAPDAFESITHARRIIDFRNQLTHEYTGINDAVVWGIANDDVLVLRRECVALIDQLGTASGAD